jgi:3-oxoadipate enol-lactonase
MEITRDGIIIGYDSYGSGELTLVLLHAFPLNRAQWQDQGEALGQEGTLRVVAPDLRGFGTSSVAVGPTTMEQMAEDVERLLDALGLGSVVLGGLSMGGYVSFACLRRFPERIRGVILADTRAGADTAEQREAREATARYAEEHGSGALVERDAGRLFSHFTTDRQPQVIARARQIAEQNASAGVAAASRGMALRPDSTDLLPQIACPALVIVGEQDAITPIAEARLLFERIPAAQLEVIADAGHVSNLEQPAAVNAAVVRFLAQHFGVAQRQP